MIGGSVNSSIEGSRSRLYFPRDKTGTVMKIFTYETESGLIRNELHADLARILRDAGRKDSIFLEPACDDLIASLGVWDGSIFSTVEIFESYGLNGAARILVATPRGSRFHAIGLNECAHADWGTSFEAFISLDYSPDDARRYNQLHECLHFFGVDDCYEEKNQYPPKSSCDSEACVMRFGNCSVGVCSQVLLQLKNG